MESKTDLDMATNGFKFDKGDLDFYLMGNILDEKLVNAIKEIKEIQGV